MFERCERLQFADAATFIIAGTGLNVLVVQNQWLWQIFAMIIRTEWAVRCWMYNSATKRAEDEFVLC